MCSHCHSSARLYFYVMLGPARAFLPHGRHIRKIPLGIGRGLQMGIDFHRGDTRLWAGLYEIELNRYLRAMARSGYYSFDIGGQYGYDALVLAKLTGSRVVCVECEESLCREIADNAAANPTLSHLVTVRHAFVSAGTSDGHCTLDDLAAETFVPDFIKIDIEGGEADALAGSSSILRERQPGLLIEVHSWDQEHKCLAILKRFSYSPTLIDPRKMLPDKRPIEHNRWILAPGAT